MKAAPGGRSAITSSRPPNSSGACRRLPESRRKACATCRAFVRRDRAAWPPPIPVAISPAHDRHHLLFRETAGQAIMMVVPEADNLKLEAKVDPKDIDRLHIGQPAVLRFVRPKLLHYPHRDDRGRQTQKNR
jgi:hypothetical protein